MKHKFKVGDKVRVLDGSNIKNYTNGWYEHMNKYVGKVYTIDVVYECLGGRVAYGVENSSLMFDERGLKFAENKVVIVYVENMTIAKYYETEKKVIIDEARKTVTTLLLRIDNKSLKYVDVAKCSPEDTFSKETGAKTALERLFAKWFDCDGFKKGEICVLCNKDNYKDFLKASKENDCNVGNYGDNLFKNQIGVKKIFDLLDYKLKTNNAPKEKEEVTSIEKEEGSKYKKYLIITGVVSLFGICFSLLRHYYKSKVRI